MEKIVLETKHWFNLENQQHEKKINSVSSYQ